MGQRFYACWLWVKCGCCCSKNIVPLVTVISNRWFWLHIFDYHLHKFTPLIHSAQFKTRFNSHNYTFWIIRDFFSDITIIATFELKSRNISFLLFLLFNFFTHWFNLTLNLEIISWLNNIAIKLEFIAMFYFKWFYDLDFIFGATSNITILFLLLLTFYFSLKSYTFVHYIFLILFFILSPTPWRRGGKRIKIETFLFVWA